MSAAAGKKAKVAKVVVENKAEEGSDNNIGEDNNDNYSDDDEVKRSSKRSITKSTAKKATTDDDDDGEYKGSRSGSHNIHLAACRKALEMKAVVDEGNHTNDRLYVLHHVCPSIEVVDVTTTISDSACEVKGTIPHERLWQLVYDAAQAVGSNFRNIAR